MAHSLKHLTLDPFSGHDLKIHVFNPHIRLYIDGLWVCANGVDPTWDSLSFPAPVVYTFLSLSLSINKLKKRQGIIFKENI